MRNLLTLCMLTIASATQSAGAQQCAPSARPFFEFQLSESARFIGDTAARPRPDLARIQPKATPTSLIVQFVVDTLGRPDESTFKVLVTPSDAAADSVRAVLAGWRFTPARAGICTVPQLFQTAIQR